MGGRDASDFGAGSFQNIRRRIGVQERGKQDGREGAAHKKRGNKLMRCLARLFIP